jgi:hypothetical protein
MRVKAIILNGGAIGFLTKDLTISREDNNALVLPEDGCPIDNATILEMFLKENPDLRKCDSQELSVGVLRLKDRI